MTTLFKSREQYCGKNLIEGVQIEVESGQFYNFCRMSQVDFELLLNMI